MVLEKLELFISSAPPPQPLELPPAPRMPAPLRDSSPWPWTLARISAVEVSIMRAVTVHTAVDLEVFRSEPSAGAQNAGAAARFLAVALDAGQDLGRGGVDHARRNRAHGGGFGSLHAAESEAVERAGRRPEIGRAS